MGHKMDKQEYAKCIEDDIDFLKRNLPESLFKCLWTSHIIEVLKASINMIYDRPSLTSDLDETAEKIYPITTTPPTPIEVAAYYNAAQQKLRDAFKAGAKWLAGQGYTTEECEEYIRKDLLLEWAKDNLLECEASNDETDYGRIDAYKKLIDKLNPL